jgi:hypothetical protein
MRLLDTDTLKMVEFFDSNIPPYAILSHRWETSEVTFQDFRDGKGSGMLGYKKITSCCNQAAADGFGYAVRLYS